MDPQAKALGELYKTKRIELGLSVKEVESATSIRSAYIEAIESGSLNQMISTVYMKGFMNQYARYLGIDATLLGSKFENFFSQDVKAEPAKEFSFG